MTTPTTDTTDRTIDMHRVCEIVRAAGAFAYVEYTGGGVATIYASADENPDRPGLPNMTHVYACDQHVGHDETAQAVAGPGWFSDDNRALGDYADFYVGPDDQGDNHPYRVTDADDEDTIADRLLTIIPEQTLTNPQTTPGYNRHRGNSRVSAEPAVDWNDRLSIIAWLCWNDRNGCYTDDDARAEGLEPLRLDEVRRLMIDQAAG